jgi:hypothetical protein
LPRHRAGPVTRRSRGGTNRLARALQPDMPPSRTVRRVIASLCSFAVGVKLALMVRTGIDAGDTIDILFTAATVAVPFVAGALVWSRRLPAQLLARAAWWSMLLCSALMAIAFDHEVQNVGALVTAFTAAALLAAGGTGLGDRPGFAPVAFRGTLLVALVLAMADTGAFAWLGAGNAIYDHSWSVLVMVVPMVAGVAGLLRLRTWGLFVGLATNVAIAALASLHVLALPPPVRQLFVGSAIVQMIVPLPMIVSILRKRPSRADAWRRTRAIAPAVVIATIAALALWAACVQGGPLFRV